MPFGPTRDHKVSLEYYHAFWISISNKNAIEAARLLVQFFKGHRSTFEVSGWVKIATARIVLEDAQAAREFVRSYWKEAQRPPAAKTGAASEALCCVQGEHRKTLACGNCLDEALLRQQTSSERGRLAFRQSRCRGIPPGGDAAQLPGG
jgi:hypothetical protein